MKAEYLHLTTKKRIEKYGFRDDLMSREIVNRDISTYINQKRAGTVAAQKRKSRKINNE